MTPLDDLRRFRRSLARTDRPAITLSYAQSLDGSLTTRRGRTLALSGPESYQLTHHLRADHDAILVGIDTVLADDPRLTVRGVRGEAPQPVVLDSRLRFPPGARLVDHPKPPWIATLRPFDEARRSRLSAAGLRILPFAATNENRVDLDAVLQWLVGEGIGSLMVEGGARVITQFLNRRRVDYAVITIAPHFVGGLRVLEGPLADFDRLPETGGKAVLLQLPGLQMQGLARFGPDAVIWGPLING